MKNRKSIYHLLGGILTILCITAGCVVDTEPPVVPETTRDTSIPVVLLTTPADSSSEISIKNTITATFSEDMNRSTINASNFTMAQGLSPVNGIVSYDEISKTAIFVPNENLIVNTVYTARVSTVVQDIAGNALSSEKVWSFTTNSGNLSPEPVSLGTAGNYVILAKTAISTIPSSVITGDVGLSPAAESFMTGFSQTKATGYSTSLQITGVMHAADMTSPTSTIMTTAISDMLLAYSDAAGRISPDYLDQNTGAIGGTTLTPGLYKWNTSVSILSDVTISGSENDIWIFQISGDLSENNGVNVILEGGAQAKNIFWQVAGTATLGTTAHFEGVILSKTSITLNTLSTMNGRALAQTNVALDQVTITKPPL